MPPSNFTDAARKLAGLSGSLLGWRPDEFWRATPAELSAVLGAMTPEEASASAPDLQRMMELFPDG